MKLLVRLTALVVAVVVLYFAVTFVDVWRWTRQDEARPADAVVVLGAAQYDGRPSPVLKARLDHAAELYRRDIADVLFVTGGRRDSDAPGQNEARAAAEYLSRNYGIPDEQILREVHGTNSWESLAAAARELKKRDLQEVVLVSDPFHSARIKAMAGELDLVARVSPTRTSPISGRQQMRRMVQETLAVGVGRLIGFRRLMDLEHVRDRALGGTASR